MKEREDDVTKEREDDVTQLISKSVLYTVIFMNVTRVLHLQMYLILIQDFLRN